MNSFKVSRHVINMAVNRGFETVQPIDGWTNDYIWLCEVQQWLRKNHNLHIVVKLGHGDTTWYSYHIQSIETDEIVIDIDDSWPDHELALEAAVKHALKIIK